MLSARDNLRALIAERNRELAFRAAIEFFTGALLALVVFAGVFVLMLFLGFLVADMIALTALQFATIAIVLFILASFFSAWRGDDPLEGLEPKSNGEWTAIMLSVASPVIVPFNPRRAAASGASVLIAGPENMVAALGTWRHRLPSDDRLIDDATNILILAQHGIKLRDITARDAAVLLRRLALIKPSQMGGEDAMVLTEKGKEAAGLGTLGAPRPA